MQSLYKLYSLFTNIIPLSIYSSRLMIWRHSTIICLIQTTLFSLFISTWKFQDNETSKHKIVLFFKHLPSTSQRNHRLYRKKKFFSRTSLYFYRNIKVPRNPIGCELDKNDCWGNTKKRVIKFRQLNWNQQCT